ncbi:MAG: glycosyltransferase family 2 protein, partial [Bdellovibrionales bacterium]|nr:glycosyltransferase family 2 protein [Bdellovibrionales bacterium]
MIKKVSIVVPVFFGEHTLEGLVSALKKELAQHSLDSEIVLVDDGSQDSSWSVIQKLSQESPSVVGVKLIRNFGEHYAITAGLDLVTGDAVGVLACDGQDNLKEIPKFLAQIESGFDVVLAQRLKRKDSFIKRVMSSAFYSFFNLLGEKSLYPNTGNYIFLSRRAVSYLRLHREGFRAFFALVAQLGLRTSVVHVVHQARQRDAGRYTFEKSLRLARDT